MTAWHPELAWDIGFQLSFLGTAAIILLTPPIERRLRRFPAAFREPLAVTCAAQVGTAPLMALDFHVISPVAPVANALVLPLLPALIGAGLLLAPTALLPPVGALFAVPVVAVLVYLEQVAGLLARLPGAAFAIGGLPPGGGIAYYLALGGAVLAAGGTALGRHRRAGLAIGIVGPLLVTGGELVGWAWPRSEAVVMNVGDGSALLLRGPGGLVLVDGGPSPSRLEDGLGARLAPWQRDLAGLVITADSIGRVGGLPGLDRRAAAVMVPASGLPGTAWRKAALAAITGGAELLPVRAGAVEELAGLTFQVLSPEAGEPGDEQGWGDLALRISSPSGRALCDFSDLVADAQRLAAQHLTRGCDYLVFGSRAAPDPDLVSSLDPSQLVLSAAAGTRAPPGLPPGLLRRTDQEGDIMLSL
jgi:competence protein ComEC